MERWQRIDHAGTEEARAELYACCGSARWVERMLARRPFGGREAALDAARDEWFVLSHEDWLEAFAQHPRIGDADALRRRFSGAHAGREQAGVSGASNGTLAALAEGNRGYEEKFGYIFIVSASGRSADEMLGMLRARLSNDPEEEFRIAAEQQSKITALRLAADDE